MIDKLIIMALTLTQRKEERGATATEYALLVALIAIVLTFGAMAFGTALRDWFFDLAGWVGGWTTP